MAQLQDFTPEQIQEALQWYRDNNLDLIKIAADSPEMRAQLYDVYFKLKHTTIELKPNQFVIGLDYTGASDAEYRKKGQATDLSNIKVNLSFWNPHPKGIADTLAKDILLSKIQSFF